MKTRNKLILSVVLGAAMTLGSGAAFAQAAPTAGGEGGTTTPAAGGEETMQATMRTEGGRRVYVATGTIEVRGEIQRPYAFSLSGRSSLGYSYLELPVRFLQEIINAVRRAPF